MTFAGPVWSWRFVLFPTPEESGRLGRRGILEKSRILFMCACVRSVRKWLNQWNRLKKELLCLIVLLLYIFVFLLPSSSSLWLHTLVAAGSALLRENHSLSALYMKDLFNILSINCIKSFVFLIYFVILAFLPDPSVLWCPGGGCRQSQMEVLAASVCPCSDSNPWVYRMCPGNGSTPPIRHK